MNQQISTSEEAIILLHKLNTGDERVLNKLYEMYFNKLLQFGMGQLNDEFTVTNIIHECFIKAWAYRETMQRLSHFYYFIRMNMKWHFLKYYGNNRYRFYLATFLMDHPEEIFQDLTYNEAEIEEKEMSEEHLAAIYRVIPLLPVNRSNVTILHYKYGLSYKAIAKRIGISNKKVIAELEKSIKSIKSLVQINPVIKTSLNAPKIILNKDIEPLDANKVLELRTVSKQSFEEIAETFQTTKIAVLQLYLSTIKKDKILDDHK